MISDWLEKNDLTQKELAVGIGISRSYLARIITGDSIPSKRVAKKIEAFTNGEITTEDILAGKGGKVPEEVQRRRIARNRVSLL
jgi:transcriptional regulator with XRE-family HTH domain